MRENTIYTKKGDIMSFGATRINLDDVKLKEITVK